MTGVAVLLLAGCAVPGRDAVAATAREWLAAVADGDAAAQCRLLTPAAAGAVAGPGETCEQAVADLDLPGGGPVGEPQVWGDQAQVRTGSDTLFLTRVAAGWRVSAAGCEFRGDRPYECEVAP